MDYKRQLQRHYGTGEGQALYRLVMEECFNLSQTDVLLGKDSDLPADDQLKLHEIISRLLKNEPIQYILGYTYFSGHRFAVRPGCLIPRPETQLLVTLAHEGLCATRSDVPCSKPHAARVLDIGTGSGCIAISLALKGHETTAMDISDEALAIAAENACHLGTKVRFVKENILQPSPTPETTATYDAIVSNPPYIRLSEAATMSANVLEHEPHLALFVPDSDPLLFYRAIARYGREHLAIHGKLYLEINEALSCEVTEMLLGLDYNDVLTIKDENEKDRIITAHL